MIRNRPYIWRLLFSALAVVLPLLLLHVHSILAQDKADQANIRLSVRETARHVAGQAKFSLENVDRLLLFLLERDELHASDLGACSELVKGLTTTAPQVGNIGVFALDGSVRCASRTTPAMPPSYANQDWFREGLKRDGLYISKPYKGTQSHRLQITLTRPLQAASGQRIGLVAASVDLARLTEQLMTVATLGNQGAVSLVDSDGTILARAPFLEAVVGRTLPADMMRRARDALDDVFEVVGVDGVKRLNAAEFIPGLKLYASAGLDVTGLAEKRRNALLTSLAIVLLEALFAALATLYLARLLNAPLTSLGHSVKAHAEGRPDCRADEALPGEFGAFALEFNRMIDAHEASTAARQAQVAAEAASEAKSAFLATISHEIRTPMNAVLGLTRLALRTELSERQRSYLSKVERAGESLLHLLNQLLDISRIEADRLELEQQALSLDSVLDHVALVTDQQATDKGIELLFLRPSVPLPPLIGDPLRLTQVLVNLCGNAIKFTEQGQVVLGISYLHPSSDGLVLHFTVKDSGIGMNASELAHVFEPFVQADASTTRRFGGSGLGLSISRELVRLMGGELLVRSEPGLGTEFAFDLDIRRRSGMPTPVETLTEPAPVEDPHMLPPVEALRGKRVLLVEDNDFNQQVAGELLETVAHMHVTIADNGEGALVLLENSSFDVVLMDIRMPGMDGHEATRRIRRMPGKSDLPVIAVTANATPGERQACLDAGMNDQVSKPFEPAELLRTLIRWTVRPGGNASIKPSP